MTTIHYFRRLARPVQILLINQLSINVGFYMLIPFLASYLQKHLGFTAWMIGLVLGIRSLSQQGLFIVGGSLSDRVGYKPIIMAGCALRTVGFLLFALVDSFAGMVIASILSGFAGALFNPAVRAYLVHEAGEQRVEAFALLNVFVEVGALVGPLLGVLLLGIGFQTVAVVASVLFLILTLLQLRYLPARAGSEAQSNQPVLADWREALSNRVFVAFALGMMGYLTLYNQLYLALPLEVQRITGSEQGIGVLFTLASVMSIALQVRLTTYCKRRWRPAQAILIGFCCMSLAFVPLLVPTLWMPVPPGSWPSLLRTVLQFSPLILSTILLTLGSMMAQPFALDMVPLLAGGRLIGTYFGVYYLGLGIGAALGNILSGAMVDLGQRLQWHGLVWLCMILVGAGAALAISNLDRRGWLVGSTPRVGEVP